MPSSTPRACAASSSRGHTPSLAHRMKSWAARHHGPSSAGTARHFAPFACRQTIASTVRRRSRGGVLAFGRHASTSGSSADHCSSVRTRILALAHIDIMLSIWVGDDMTRAATTELILETFRLNGRLLAAGDALVRDLGLTSARWQVLGAVAMSRVPLPVSHTARNMGLSRQGVQRVADELEARGIVRFAPNPHHRRARLVLLTERGRALYEAAAERQGPWAAALSDGLPVEAATGLLRALRDRLEGTPAGG